MKQFLIKSLISLYATRKNGYFMLAMLVIATIITRIWGKMTASRTCLILCICLMAYMFVLSIACSIHRNKHKGFKVYLSFSVDRIPGVAQYISDYLKPAFWIFNIDYYDFREHKQFHYLDEGAICEEIDKNLANSDIFLRFISHGLEPNKSHSIIDIWSQVKYNPFTHSLSGTPDYADYEVNASFDKFGFNNPCNRFQIMPAEMMTAPMEHIHTVYIDTERDSALDVALRLINELSGSYIGRRGGVRYG